jgi:NADH:ubiquinone oxidoreductase subunit 2 (subunit N)
MVSAVIAAFVYLRIVVAMFMTATADHDGEEGAGLPSDVGEGVVEPAPSGDGGGVAVLTATRLRVPVGSVIALGIAVGVTLVVGFLPGLVTSLAKDAIPVLMTSK